MNYKQVISSRKGESYKDFARGVYEIMGHGSRDDMPEEYYQHVMQFLDGKVNARPNEKEAMNFYIELTRDPIAYGKLLFGIRKIKRQLKYVEEKMLTGVYNKSKLRSIFRKIRQAIQ